MTSSLPAAITIRHAFADDQLALIRLAALDSSPAVPAPPALVAEVDGELRAALSLQDGSEISDPFYPTLDLLELLRKRANGLARPRERRSLRRSLAIPSLRLGARPS